MTRTGFYPQEDRDVASEEGPTSALTASSYGVWWPSGRRAGEVPDPREAQIERLKAQNPWLKDRVTDRDATIEELTEFMGSRPAACGDTALMFRGG
ncbi:hypothetical protein [Streptomyces olivochromogenes]|uniref:hypothetical protein n=1 Tax=Streptomyces olivochromogenes TaxID=1963 RepID=UPI00369E3138